MARSEDAQRHDHPGPAALAALGIVFALWLTAAFGLSAYVSGERYPSLSIVLTFLILALGLVVPLTVWAAVAKRFGALAAAGPLAAAYCVLFAALVSLDVTPRLGSSKSLAAARLLLLAASAGVALWSLKRARVSRFSLGLTLLVPCLGWIVCGLLRTDAVPRALSQPAILAPVAAALAVLLPGLPRLEPWLSPRWHLVTLGAGALLALLPFSSVNPPPVVAASAASAAPPNARSVLLIVLDTLRRDHVSLYGYARKTTPAIDEHAKRGLVFEDATSVTSWTLPSHASMFTGLWPRSHGARGFRVDKPQLLDAYPLAPERLTLAEIARSAGYRTAGLVANHSYLTPLFGVHQGFQHYLCRPPRGPGVLLRTARNLAGRWDKRRVQYEEMPYFTAPEITGAAISWLERNREAPFFLFLNYLDVHIPNAAPGSQGLPFEDEAPFSRALRDRVLAGQPIPVAVKRGLVNEYDRELIHLDRWVGALLDYVQRVGLSEKTLIILTSDHGELLGEHEMAGHSQDLYAPLVDVPLVVWEPGGKPGRESRPVQSLDLFVTMLEYLGLPIPEGTQGQSMLKLDHSVVSELYYSRQQHMLSPAGRRFDRILRTVRMDGYHYFNGSNGEERLFSLLDDPGETIDLVRERPEQARLARARLEEWLARVAEAPPPSSLPQAPDAKTLEGLRALGYVN